MQGPSNPPVLSIGFIPPCHSLSSSPCLSHSPVPPCPQSGWLRDGDVTALEQEYCELLAVLRQDAVTLVDAFDIHDKILDSTLGSWDGRVYERWGRGITLRIRGGVI